MTLICRYNTIQNKENIMSNKPANEGKKMSFIEPYDPQKHYSDLYRERVKEIQRKIQQSMHVPFNQL